MDHLLLLVFRSIYIYSLTSFIYLLMPLLTHASIVDTVTILVGWTDRRLVVVVFLFASLIVVFLFACPHRCLPLRRSPILLFDVGFFSSAGATRCAFPHQPRRTSYRCARSCFSRSLCDAPPFPVMLCANI